MLTDRSADIADVTSESILQKTTTKSDRNFHTTKDLSKKDPSL